MEAQKVMTPSSTPDVLIIGGGLAGLSAAVALTSQRYSVLLVEQRQRLGGRTYSFVHPETGDEVDNGQHLMMGCYHSTLNYLGMIDKLSLVEIQPNLSIVFRDPKKSSSSLKTISLPAPFNVLAGLLNLETLSFSNRLALLRVGISLLFKNPDTDKHLQSISVAQWLDELKQPIENKKYLWDIIAIGALNDSTDRISASLFVKVLKSAFFGSRKNSSMVIPKKGLSSVLVDGAVEYIQKRGGKILTNVSVKQISIRASHLESVTLESGEVIKPTMVISAVPYFDIPKLFGNAESIGLNNIDKFVSSPIITIHLWLDAHFMQEQFAALLDSPIHWVFNKSKIYGRENEGLMYLALVVSGAHDLVEKEKDEIVEIAHCELKRFYPTASVAKVIHSLIIKEKRATFSPKVGLDQFRPGHQTAVDNLFLAGDWTDTKLPATIEGAVQSGFDCANAIDKIFISKR
ncbi:MAG: hydroxysqualene dehydroxylase HpnE [Bacteroidota bacterium]